MKSICSNDQDIMYLTYPMNFNVTPQITRNDAETFIPITCQENAGMTGPIHAIVWLMLNETLRAEAEFNRSMQACTYSAFHVRNEVCFSTFVNQCLMYGKSMIICFRSICIVISLEDMVSSKIESLIRCELSFLKF